MACRLFSALNRVLAHARAIEEWCPPESRTMARSLPGTTKRGGLFVVEVCRVMSWVAFVRMLSVGIERVPGVFPRLQLHVW